MKVLSSLRGLTVKLQKSSKDIIAAYNQVAEVQLKLELLKINCEEEFHLWFEEITKDAESLDIPISVPRTHSRQIHRSNIPGDTPEAYYMRNVMIPFLAHILIEMEERFGSTHHTVVKLLGLIPASCESISSLQDVSKIYACDLPSPSVLSFKFANWKMFASTRK